MAAADLLSRLKERGETLAFCESLTAGLAAASFADVPGASAVLRGGMVTYATAVKAHFLRTSVDSLNAQGVVSAATAKAMARAAVQHCDSTWGISLTGVAGPDPQEGHPAGTVFIGLANQDGRCIAHRAQGLEGDRQAIRRGAVDAAFELLENTIVREQKAALDR